MVTVQSEQVASSWTSWFNPYDELGNRNYDELESRISDIANRELFTEQDVIDLKNAYYFANRSVWPVQSLRDLLSTFPQARVNQFIATLMERENIKDIDALLHTVIEIARLTGFDSDAAAAISFENHGFAKETALKSQYGEELRTIFQEAYLFLSQLSHEIIQLTLSLFGVEELTRTKYFRGPGYGGNRDSYSKYQIYQDLFFLPFTIFGGIYAVLEMELISFLITAAIVIAASVLIIAYNRYWKPCPRVFQGLVNLNMAMIKEHDPIYHRNDILERIKAAFNSGKGVLLIGEPGSGKTLIANAIAELANDGALSSKLTNPQVFSFNAADCKPFEGVSLLEIEESFTKYKDQVVFFIDEIKALFETNNQFSSASSQKIKTFAETFRYIIGATTREEYNEVIRDNNTIINRRFEVVEVPAMSEEEIRETLMGFMQGSRSNIPIDPEVFDYIIANASDLGTSTIDAAVSILKRAIEKVVTVEPVDLIAEVTDGECQMENVRHQMMQGNGHISNDLNQQMRNLRAEHAASLEALHVREVRIARLQQMEQYHAQLKRECYVMADPESPYVDGSPLADKWKQLHALLNFAREFIQRERTALQLPYRIDQAMIEAIIQERRERIEVIGEGGGRVARLYKSTTSIFNS